MFIVVNRANLVVCKTSGVKYVRQQPNGVTVLAQDGNATAIYATDTDAFYPLSGSGEWDCESYRAIELEEVPEDVVVGYWYYSGEFFTTPEKEAELAAQKEQETINNDVFAALTELGGIVANMGV